MFEKWCYLIELQDLSDLQGKRLLVTQEVLVTVGASISPETLYKKALPEQNEDL